MAQLWCDSFDSYGSISDVTSRYGGSSSSGSALSAATAFSSGQAVNGGNTGSLGVVLSLPVPTWGSNETTLYGSVRLKWNSATAIATSHFFITFQDGASNQCTIRWSGDGSIGLLSGAYNGTLLQSYASQFTINGWDSWQFKVVINNTTGSIELRKNGASSDAVSLTGANTRAGTANSYTNAATLGSANTSATPNSFQIDDFFLASSSGAAPNSWLGDMRAIQQTPNGQSQAQMAVVPATSLQTNVVNNSWGVQTNASVAYFSTWTPTVSGSFTSVFDANARTAMPSGHCKLALYDNAGTSGGPKNLIVQSAEVAGASSGSTTFTFTSTAVVKGTTYWWAFLADTSVMLDGASGGTAYTQSMTYASGFPSVTSVPATAPNGTISYSASLSVAAWFALSESVDDADATYVTSSTAGQEDIYTLSSIPTAYTVVGVEYYAWWRKADAGARTAQLSVSANGSADTSEITTSTLGDTYTVSNKFLAVDPTGVAWTPTTVNGAKIGISVTA